MGSQTDPQDGQDVHSRYSKEIHRTLTELPSWIYAVTPGLNWWLNTIWNSHCKTNCWHHIFGIGNYTRWLTKFRISRLLKMKDVVSLEQCIIWFCHIMWHKFYPLSPNCWNYNTRTKKRWRNFFHKANNVLLLIKTMGYTTLDKLFVVYTQPVILEGSYKTHNTINHVQEDFDHNHKKISNDS